MSIADKLKTIAENMPIVFNEGQKDGFDKGMKDGEEIGYNSGKIDGQKAQYDLFWDVFQKNGTRTDYRYAFSDWDGADELFKPKYSIKPTGSIEYMFNSYGTWTSLPEVCEAQGITIDFSKVTNFARFLYNSAIKEVGVIDCASTTTLYTAFQYAGTLRTIRELKVHEGITNYQHAFNGISDLPNITVSGTIAGDNLDLSANTTLTYNSLMSIINALKDYSGTTTTKTVTLGTTNLAKLSDAEKSIATQKGWSLA
jgi:hypothetical protein